MILKIFVVDSLKKNKLSARNIKVNCMKSIKGNVEWNCFYSLVFHEE